MPASRVANMGLADHHVAIATPDVLPVPVLMKDDWTQVSSAEERRRIQNRVNQRAARRRKKPAAKEVKLESGGVKLEPCKNQVQMTSLIQRDVELWQYFFSAMKSANIDRSTLVNFARTYSTLSLVDIRRILQSFQHWTYFALGSPDRDCLFTLVQFNVFRAMTVNEAHIGLPQACALDDDAVSIIGDLHETNMPPSLRPTALQQSIEHHPWIDLLPSARLRDNLLLAMDEYDEEALCESILGCESMSSDRTGVIVWGEAWDPAGWEFTEEFIARWAWALYGCEELLASTNYWRKQRGKGVLKMSVEQTLQQIEEIV